ncbi:MAG TPA: NAD(P)-binding protein [Vicinamibacterales bacterium]|nr:NAD(P)-binding protein [Vicinamibacterales bacterium]
MRIAVVGAGISGLAAARALAGRGHDVRVFEQSRVPGGRVATRTITAIELPRGLSGEVAFDHGAQYFTVRDDRFSMAAAEWERDRVIAKWTGRIVSFDGEGWEDVDEATSRYVGTPGMAAIGAAMAAGLDVEYGRRIDSVAQLDAFDRVIIATPPDRASALAAQVPSVLLKPCWAVMAAFEERVAARFDAAFVNGSAVSWIARNSSKPKRNWKIDTWVVHASTAWSEAHLDDRADEVGAFLMEAFDDLIAAGLPKAFYATVHRWKYATADPPLAVGAIDQGRVILCGDWCRGSRIEDAYVSGIEAAEVATKDTKYTKYTKHD